MPASSIHRQWNFELPVNALVINRDGDFLAVALGDGSLRLLRANDIDDHPKTMALHNGVSLSLKPDADGHAFLSGGDDGKIFIIDPKLETPTLLAEHKGAWIDHVAGAAQGGFRAYAIGKAVYLLDEEGAEKLGGAKLVSSAGGLAFSPNGKRLAATHYNGISLWWTHAAAVAVAAGGTPGTEQSRPTQLMWKGSHLDALWHPDGKILVTSLQENALHGWRLADQAEMQMQGYAGKIRSMAFTGKGRYLVTSGAEQVIGWPFFGGGPWNKTPLTLGGTDSRLVTCVAPHPHEDMVAAGYDDGMIILAPLDGRMEIMVLPPSGSPITGLVWNGAGDCLFAAHEGGYLTRFTTDSVRKAATHA